MMPRGKKKVLNYDEQLELIDGKIKKYTQRIADLKQQRQECVLQKQQQTMRELQSYMQQHNMDPASVLSALERAAASSSVKSVQV